MYTFLIIIIYLAIIIIKEKKIPHSISETRYYLDNPIWFTVIMLFISYNLLPLIIKVTPEYYQIFAFLSCIGISFIGVADDFRGSKSTDIIHTIAAMTSFICSQIWVGLTVPNILYTWILILLYFVVKLFSVKNIKGIFKYTNIKFYAELIAIINIYLALFLLL